MESNKISFCYPYSDKKATTVARELYNNVLSVFGPSDKITSDRGREFVNSVLQSLCKYNSIKDKLSTAYHPETNGLVERFNRTLKEGLRKFASHHKQDWDLYLQGFMYGIRTVSHDSTGYSPMYLTIGRHSRLPGDRIVKQPPQTDDEWINNLHNAIELAVDNSNKAAEKYKKQYDSRNKNRMKEFNTGEYVMIKNHNKGEGSKKLSLNWNGPFRVEEQKNKGVYRLSRPDGSTLTMNITNLAPWEPEIEEFPEGDGELDAIIDDKVNEEGKTLYKCTWHGNTRKRDSWLPEENINNSKVLEEYKRLLEFRESPNMFVDEIDDDREYEEEVQNIDEDVRDIEDIYHEKDDIDEIDNEDNEERNEESIIEEEAKKDSYLKKKPRSARLWHETFNTNRELSRSDRTRKKVNYKHLGSGKSHRDVES